MRSCCDHTSKPVSKEHPTVYVTSSQLPLHCPLEGAPLWSLHPRVFLPIEESGKVTCPYCSTIYELKVKN